MGLCVAETNFKSSAFEGCMIGLSIGLVVGTIRAISLSGVPHSENETPGNTFVSHTLSGFIAGSLIGVVYAFLTQCIFK